MTTPQPRASYRLQLTKNFTFADVEAIAPYLGRLGISHAYLSPILKARAGSTHGYDTVDHTQINPELGTIDDFRRMAATLRAQCIGIILDIVPNHMGIGGADNPYWLNLLEHGRNSQYADWFDVNWTPSEPTLENKVLVPFLGCSYAEALETGRLQLQYDVATDTFAVWAEDTHKLPIDPRTYGDIRIHGESAAAAVDHLNSPAGRKKLADLIDRQNWRAARYSVAADDINYRRFFIVSDLGAIRIEKEEVFDHAHRLIFQLVEEGLVEGLRIDHIDGLYDPKAYALRLREKCPRPIYLVVEKILAEGEQLRADWGVDGTTGYEFANAIAQLLTDPAAEQAMTDFYRDFTSETDSLEEIEREAKLEIIDYEMAAELDALTTRLCAIAKSDRATVDLTYNGIRNGLRHLVASMNVYRTYVDGTTVDERDGKTLSEAVAHARQMAPTLDPAIFAFLEKVARAEPGADAESLEAAMRLQQYTGPVMAKGLEDTALYRFNRLLALNDVGEKPDIFSAGPEAFHAFNTARAETAPLGMLTSSSHDTKRGEDVRARIAALSLVPEEWQSGVRRWQDMLAASGVEPIHPNDLYYLLQQTVGAFPSEMGDFLDRSKAAMMKAVREARLRSSWTAPDQAYGKKIDATLEALLSGELLADLKQFVDRIGPLGARNTLIAATLKLTAPGMPDIYQGAELFEQSLVDPDNRRPVDFDRRIALLDDLGTPSLDAEWATGKAKLTTIHTLLQLRRELPDLFAKGTYEPVAIDNDSTGRGLAFIRRNGDEAILVVAWLGLADQIGEASIRIDGDWHPVLGSGTDSKKLADLLGELPVGVFRKR